MFYPFENEPLILRLISNGPNSARQSKNGTSDAQSPILGMLRNSKLGFGDFKKEGFFVKNQNRVKKSEEMMPAE